MDAAKMSQLDRIEARQAAYEQVVQQMLSTLAVHTEMLQEIMKAATADPGPSPVADTLKQILAVMETTNAVLVKLPAEIAARISELDEEDLEPAEPGAFDRQDEDGDEH